jgi:5-methylcytosine-specific restriction protein B
MTTNQLIAYLLGAYWYDNDPRDQTSRFVQNGIWENGYDTEYLDLVKSIAVGNPVFIKSLFYHNGLKTSVLRAKAKGIVTANQGDGRHLTVDWDKSFKEEDFTEKDVPGVGRYWDTVERVTEPRHLAALLHQPLPSVKAKLDFPLNQILYGPPGTGKTYHTATRAVGILEGLTDEQTKAHYTRSQVRARFDEYHKAGWISFVTFHQAFSYEDFVEGIKPEVVEETEGLRYAIEPGVFRTLADKALAVWQQAQQPAADIPLPFEVVYEAYLADLQQRIDAGEGQAMLQTVENYDVFATSIDSKNAVRIAHANAVKATPIAEKWTRLVYSQFASASDIVPMNKTMRKIGGPNASLQWAVFNDLKKFEAAHKAELQAAAAAEETASVNPAHTPRYVLIIDEINRGNVANIFGELITLLEDDKRAGRSEALTVKLPYSKEDFTVPDNLYLLGTMNTADRSVEALDTALRRRFSFTEMLPDAQVIRDHVGEGGKVEGVDVAQILEVLNSRLEQLLDRDHCLGHALLLRVTDLDGLRAAFQRNVLPLLQEYFFGDWGKIGLVLGERFITTADKTATRYPLAKFSGYDSSGPRERPLYRLTAPDTWDAAAFQSIYAVA